MSKDEMQSLVSQIANALGETGQGPLSQIAAIIKLGGAELAQSFLDETLAIQAQGGMMLPDQSRMRTPGGVFFHLARKKLPRAVARSIFLPRGDGQHKPEKSSDSPVSQPSKPVFNWEDRLHVLEPLLAETGEINDLKVSLTGRPGKIDESHKDLVITTMSYTLRPTSIPKGVPRLPDRPTIYTVYISAKQWKKVEEAIADPDDFLIIEGSCAFDEQIGGVAVYAMSVSTKLLEVKKREAQKAAAEESGSAKSRPESAPAPQPYRPRREFDGSAAPSVTATATMPGVPTEVSQKLTELYASASLFRQKIATIQSKPAGQQFGLEMTQKLLKNIEDEIAAIEKKYQ